MSRPVLSIITIRKGFSGADRQNLPEAVLFQPSLQSATGAKVLERSLFTRATATAALCEDVGSLEKKCPDAAGKSRLQFKGCKCFEIFIARKKLKPLFYRVIHGS